MNANDSTNTRERSASDTWTTRTRPALTGLASLGDVSGRVIPLRYAVLPLGTSDGDAATRIIQSIRLGQHLGACGLTALIGVLVAPLLLGAHELPFISIAAGLIAATASPLALQLSRTEHAPSVRRTALLLGLPAALIAALAVLLS